MYRTNYKNLKLWLWIPGGIFFVLAMIAFIISSFMDMEISEFFAQGMKYPVVRWWVVIWDEAGLSQLIGMFAACAFILIETFVYYHKQKKNSWMRRNENLVNILYIGWFVIWITINVFWIIEKRNMTSVFGDGTDAKLIDTYVPRMSARIILFVIESSFQVIGLYYLRFKFSKRDDILIKAYWIDVIKILVYAIWCYIFVITIKQSMGRPYFYYTSGILDVEVWNEALNNLPNNHQEINDYFENYGEVVRYFPWWERNGNWIDQLAHWQPWNQFIPDSWKVAQPLSWNNVAFPSGHTVGTFSLLSLLYLFVGKSEDRKVRVGLRIFGGIWFLHMMSMNFSLVVYRFHWLTDTTFSMMLSLLSLPIVGWIVDRWVRHLISKFNKRFKGIDNKVIYEYHDKWIVVKVKHYDYEAEIGHISTHWSNKIIDSKMKRIEKRHRSVNNKEIRLNNNK
ncbi:phosphatase PAP2 family protein [[Acholeplasma] multilocale]|uniref:phosphatase PAP2 family protein n=1 Tax=[Acholeplasma] multilocale TaxID=264638 RepID=UPI000479EDA1|nr:phosphatase PAP2 family protein [[Acholeplasma] multilocale]